MVENNKTYIISEVISAKIEGIKKKFPLDKKKSAIIESLLLLQHENNGHVTKEIMKSLAAYLEVDTIDVYEIASFYSMINTEPVGRNVISICTNVSCMLKDSQEILEHIEKKLQVKVGNSKKDKKFLLLLLVSLLLIVLFINRPNLYYFRNIMLKHIFYSRFKCCCRTWAT